MAAVLPHHHAAARRRTPSITESGPLTNVLAGQDTFCSGPGVGPEYDYPNPRGRAFPQELRTFLCALPLALLSVALPPGQQHATNPAAKPFPQDLRTFVSPTPLNLIGQDAFFAAAGQSPRYDYPNPAGRRFIPADAAGPNNLVLGTVVVAPATVVFDFPNPRGRAFANGLRTWCVSTYAGLAGKDRFFGAAGQPPAYDFPNPTLRKPAASAGWAQPTSLAALTPPAPTALHVATVLTTEIDLAWSVDTASETGLKLERSTPDDLHFLQIATPAQMDSAYSDTGLTPGTVYYYRIRATNGGVDGPYSGEISATTLLAGAPATTVFDWPNPRGRVVAAGIADQVQNIVVLGSAPIAPSLLYLFSTTDGKIYAATTA